MQQREIEKNKNKKTKQKPNMKPRLLLMQRVSDVLLDTEREL